jgi:muramidase (phage lysozyme)
MRRTAIIAAGGMVAYGAYLMTQSKGEVIDLTAGNNSMPDYSNAGTVLTNAAQTAVDFIDRATMGIFSISNMNRAKPEMLAIPNVRAMLAVIRKGEGTSDGNGYRRIFGGQLFDSYKDHPRIKVTKNGYISTAAGAYQFLAKVWDETKNTMHLPDFSPASQDLGALGRIAARGALDDVIAGRFTSAISKMGKEWASLPGSPYGQPTQTMQGAQAVYLASNGSITTT